MGCDVASRVSTWAGQCRLRKWRSSPPSSLSHRQAATAGWVICCKVITRKATTDPSIVTQADLASRLRLSVTRTARRLRQEAGTDLSPSLQAALATIERHGPLTPSELADAERVQRPTATRVAARLEEQGLIERTGDPADRRVSLLSVTRDGRELLRRLRRARTSTSHAGSGICRRRTWRRSNAPPTCSSGCSRTDVTAELKRPFASLSVRNYRRYFAGQVVSLSGNWVQIVAETWLILQLTDSPVAVGLTAALQFAPMLLFGALGGVFADRFDKRRLLMVTQAAMALPALGLFVLATAGAVEPWMVFVLVFARGAVLAVDNPTRQSFVIEMVGPDRLVNAVNLNSALIHVARMAGPAVAGVADLSVGVEPCFLLNAVSFAAMLFALRGMRPAELARPELHARRRGALREALRYVRAHRPWRSPWR